MEGPWCCPSITCIITFYTTFPMYAVKYSKGLKVIVLCRLYSFCMVQVTQDSARHQACVSCASCGRHQQCRKPSMWSLARQLQHAIDDSATAMARNVMLGCQDCTSMSCSKTIRGCHPTAVLCYTADKHSLCHGMSAALSYAYQLATLPSPMMAHVVSHFPLPCKPQLCCVR